MNRPRSIGRAPSSEPAAMAVGQPMTAEAIIRLAT
jgi:hypothetical protein